MLSKAYFLAKFRFDTAENEPAKNLQNIANFANLNPQPLSGPRAPRARGARARGASARRAARSLPDGRPPLAPRFRTRVLFRNFGRLFPAVSTLICVMHIDVPL